MDPSILIPLGGSLLHLGEDVSHDDEGKPGPLGGLVQLRLQRTVLQSDVSVVPENVLSVSMR